MRAEHIWADERAACERHIVRAHRKRRQAADEEQRAADAGHGSERLGAAEAQDRRDGWRGDPDHHEGCDRPPVHADRRADRDTHHRADEDLNRRGRDADAVVDRSHAERDRDDDDFAETRGCPVDQPAPDGGGDLAARKRGAGKRERSHQPEGDAGPHHAERIRHSHARARVVRPDRPGERERERDEEEGHTVICSCLPSGRDMPRGRSTRRSVISCPAAQRATRDVRLGGDRAAHARDHQRVGEEQPCFARDLHAPLAEARVRRRGG